MSHHQWQLDKRRKWVYRWKRWSQNDPWVGKEDDKGFRIADRAHVYCNSQHSQDLWFLSPPVFVWGDTPLDVLLSWWNYWWQEWTETHHMLNYTSSTHYVSALHFLKLTNYSFWLCAESFTQFLISHCINFALYSNVPRSDSGEEEIGIKSRRICAAVHWHSISIYFRWR